MVGKDVVDEQILNCETGLREELFHGAPRVRVGHRAAGLGFGVPRHSLIQLPEGAMGLSEQDREHLPGPPVVHHHLESRVGAGVVLADLFQHPVRMWRVMYHAKRIHEIISGRFHELRQSLRIRLNECDLIAEPEDVRALARKLERAARKIDGCHPCPRPGEVHRLGAEPATDLEYPLSGPSGIVGEAGNMRFNEVLPRLDLIEVLA